MSYGSTAGAHPLGSKEFYCSGLALRFVQIYTEHDTLSFYSLSLALNSQCSKSDVVRSSIAVIHRRLIHTVYLVCIPCVFQMCGGGLTPVCASVCQVRYLWGITCLRGWSQMPTVREMNIALSHETSSTEPSCSFLCRARGLAGLRHASQH